jgi:hypothetical protein
MYYFIEMTRLRLMVVMTNVLNSILRLVRRKAILGDNYKYNVRHRSNLEKRRILPGVTRRNRKKYLEMKMIIHLIQQQDFITILSDKPPLAFSADSLF